MSDEAIIERPTEAPVLDVDLYSTDVLLDPYSFYCERREAGPVALIKPYGTYAVGHHAESVEVLTDTHGSRRGGVVLQDVRKPGTFRIPRRLHDTDPPEHTDVRGALTKYLSPIVIRRCPREF